MVVYPCTRRSVTYQNICLKCNPGGGGKVSKLNGKADTPSVYIGETGRSLFERGREHRKDFREGMIMIIFI